MDVQTVILRISLNRSELISLLLVHGQVQTTAKIGIVGEEIEIITLNSAIDHQKFGNPGEEEGNHLFVSEVLYKGHYITASCSLNTSDKGKTFQGSLNLKTYPDNKMGE